MSIEELEAEALKLDPKARARLAGRLLDSLEQLSPEENARVWAGEAARRAEAQAIVEFFFAAPEIQGGIRRRLCDRFPYAILYSASAQRSGSSLS